MTEPITIGEKPASNRRALVMLGAAAGLLFVALVVPKVLFTDASSSTATSPDIALAPAGAAVSTTTSSTVPTAAELAAAPIVKAKNPFTPLVDVAAPAVGSSALGPSSTPAAVAPPAPTVIDTSGIDTTGIDTSGFSTTPIISPVASDPAAAQPVAGQTARVALLEVYRDVTNRVIASVRVDDVTYEVGAGDVFAGGYGVVSVDDGSRCAQLSSPGGAASFSLCEGEEAIK